MHPFSPPTPGNDGQGTPTIIVCGNCGTPLSGLFCFQCGQKNLIMRDYNSFDFAFKFIKDQLSDLHFSSSVLNLLFRPGELTRAFMSGQRIRYMHPVKGLILCFTICGILNTWFISNPNEILDMLQSEAKSINIDLESTINTVWDIILFWSKAIYIIGAIAMSQFIKKTLPTSNQLHNIIFSIHFFTFFMILETISSILVIPSGEWSIFTSLLINIIASPFYFLISLKRSYIIIWLTSIRISILASLLFISLYIVNFILFIIIISTAFITIEYGNDLLY